MPPWFTGGTPPMFPSSTGIGVGPNISNPAPGPNRLQQFFQNPAALAGIAQIIAGTLGGKYGGFMGQGIGQGFQFQQDLLRQQQEAEAQRLYRQQQIDMERRRLEQDQKESEARLAETQASRKLRESELENLRKDREQKSLSDLTSDLNQLLKGKDPTKLAEIETAAASLAKARGLDDIQTQRVIESARRIVGIPDKPPERFAVGPGGVSSMADVESGKVPAESITMRNLEKSMVNTALAKVPEPPEKVARRELEKNLAKIRAFEELKVPLSPAERKSILDTGRIVREPREPGTEPLQIEREVSFWTKEFKKHFGLSDQEARKAALERVRPGRMAKEDEFTWQEAIQHARVAKMGELSNLYNVDLEGARKKQATFAKEMIELADQLFFEAKKRRKETPSPPTPSPSRGAIGDPKGIRP